MDLNAQSLRMLALIVAASLISVLFYSVAQPFLIALFMAALAAEMARPLRRRIARAVGGPGAIASVLTLLVVVVAVIVPLFVLGYMAATQAAGLVGTMREVAQHLAETQADQGLPDWIPRDDWLEARLDEWWPAILRKLGDLGTAATAYFISLMSSMTRGAARMFLDLFVFLYALYFFLGMRTPILEQLLAFTGLSAGTQAQLAERAVSITRATLKGTIVIALVQGCLGGVGFWVAGFDGVAFWTVIMIVMAMIPAIGASTVIVGGAVFLLLKGQVLAGIALAIWGALVVGSADNVLRPSLVGRDAKLNEILILISTLGGLGVFGLPGLVIGPVLAGLFVTIWTTLRDVMAETEGPGPEEPEC